MASGISSQQLYNAARESKELPVPDEFALQHSKKLIEYIKAEIIKNNGKISFQRYMELALYAPGLGYYAAGSTKFGASGDFITAPEISPLYSQCIANAILPILDDNKIILEVGAGSGCMAAEILCYLKQQNKLPDVYYILELSADLRLRQQKYLKTRLPELFNKLEWLDSLPENFSGVVLANELLDAMPIQIFLKNKTDVDDIDVVVEQDKFAYQAKKCIDNRLSQRVSEIESQLEVEFAEGYYSEVNFAAEDWIQSIAERMQQGLILLIDYGFPRHEYYHAQRQQGTLMCHYRHRSHPDPFVYPGLQDITTHVDFTAMADAALDAGLKVTGYCNQMSFLMGAGLLELAAAQQLDFNPTDDQAEIKKQLEITTQIKKLTMPHEMGELFKVIGFSKNCDTALPAFQFNDMRDSL